MKNYYPRLKSLVGSCALAFSSAIMVFSSQSSIAQPTISSVTPGVSGITGAATITITGSNFSTTLTNNIVYFGGVKGTVSSGSATTLAVQVPIGASYDRLTVVNTALTTNRSVIMNKPFNPLFFNTCFVPAQFNFKPRVDIALPMIGPGGGGTYMAAFADLDGDGKLDYALANNGRPASSSIMFSRNTNAPYSISQAGFSGPDSFGTLGGASNIKVADLDADGKLDLITGCTGGGGGMVLSRNLSSGTTISLSYRPIVTGGKVSETAIADFDGDGRPDIAATVTNAVTLGADSVKIYMNAIVSPPATNFTNTSFQNPTSVAYPLPVGSGPVSIATADFDGDGRMDLVVLNQNFSGTGSISIFRNVSTGVGSYAFDPYVNISLPVGQHGMQVIATDLDGDTKPDILAAANDFGTGGTLYLLKNAISAAGTFTTGSFSALSTIASGPQPVGVSAGDLDADGKVDVVVTDMFDNNIRVYRNTSTPGTVTLSVVNTYAVGNTPISSTIADVDGDGKLDIVVSNRGATPGLVSSLSIFRNYPIPSIGPAITGPSSLCIPTADTFKNSVAGGEWILSNTTLATINSATGVVTPLAVGTDTVTYRIICNGDTSLLTRSFTINALPVVNPISGTATTLCRTATITLTETATGGAWSSSNSAIASVTGTTTATVTGVSAGTAVITYAATNSCGTSRQTYAVTVNPTPGPILGTLAICVGGNTTLSDTAAGTWSSVTPSVASITSGGLVHGATVGNTTISYTAAGGCAVTAVVTVTAGPVIAPITGASSSVCLGSNLTLSNITTPGTWSSNNNTIASVSTSGVVHGNTVGNTTISYTVTNGCGTDFVTYPVTVNPVPANITGTIFHMCQGNTITLSDVTAGGTWSASAGVSLSAAGTLTGVTGTSAGTSTVSYTLSGGCFVTANVTVDAIPTPIGGGNNVCVGSNLTLTNTSTPGTWAVTSGGFATIGSSTGVIGGVNAGSIIVTFTQTSNGCSATLPFTVNALPASISGSTVACVGAVNTLTSSGTGTWSVTPTTVANIDPVSGAVTGILPGSAVVSYSLTATGCSVSTPITVSPSPGVITGPSSVCLGAFITLSDTPSTGTWFSSNAVAAPINALGIVSGATLGSTTISYTLPSGCRATRVITVTPPPGAITGSVPLCPYTNITLNDTSAGGLYSSGNLAIATVNPTTGVVSGVSGGTVMISYSLVSTGCSVFVPVTVNPAPTVTGTPYVCLNHTTLLGVDSVSGVWSSTDTNIVKVDTATGLMHGRTPGTVTITYTTPGFHCFDTIMVTSFDTVTPLISVTVSPTLTLVGHLASVCQNTTVTYTANIINGGPTPNFQWRVNGALVGTGPSYTYIPNNGDSVSCRLTSSALCAFPLTSSDYIKMNVITRRTPIMNLATGIGDTTCLGVPVTLNPNTIWGGAAPTYAWKINGINVGPGSTFTYVPANGDIITVVVHSNYICPLVDTATDTLHLTVSPYLTPVVNVLGSDTTCEGYPTVYTAVPVNGGTNPTFQWHVNGVNAGTGTTLAYMATNGDNVDVTMTSNFPCLTYSVTTSTTHVVTIVPVPIPSISVAVTPGYILAPGMTATFIATPVNPGPNPSYRWKKNGVLIPGATTLTYATSVFASGDSFTCIMTTNSLCNHISVYSSVEVYVGDNVGVGQVNSPNSVLNVVPNPTSGSFSIIGNTGISTNEEVNVEITNMLGQVVYRARTMTSNGAIEEHLQLDPSLANGMYLLNVHSEHLSRTLHFELAK